MGLNLPHIDPSFVSELDLIVERIILHPAITREQEKRLRQLLDSIETKQMGMKEAQTLLTMFEQEIG